MRCPGLLNPGSVAPVAQRRPPQHPCNSARTTHARSLRPFLVSLDSSTVALYDSATKPLPDLFGGGDGRQVLSFANQLYRRSQEFQWEPVLTVLQQGKSMHIARHYGEVTTATVRAHAATYIGRNVRNNQLSQQVFKCLDNSLEPELRATMANKAEDYTIENEVDGPLYFMAIMKEAQVQTQGTVAVLQTELYNLPKRLAELDNDIKKFNDEVENIKRDLEARGRPPEDSNLINLLFVAYDSCPDEKFRAYIDGKQSDFNDGKAMTSKELLASALSKYTWLSDRHMWMETVTDKKKILALTAQLEEVKKQVAAAKKPTLDSKLDKPKAEEKKRKQPEWKLVAPKEGDAKTKVNQGKTYHWCPHHGEKGMWVIHDPKECKAKPVETQKSTSGGQLQANNTLAAVTADDFDEDDE